MHLADTDSRDIYGPNKGPGNSYAHFYNRRSGLPLQHQQMNRQAAADYRGNSTTISVEHQGRAGDKMTNVQKKNLAQIFAWAVVYHGVPNWIATVGNTSGLAWHRLGVSGNFGTYDPKRRRTWSRAQTGEVWSTVVKTCPTNAFIAQIGDVHDKAQFWINEFRNR